MSRCGTATAETVAAPQSLYRFLVNARMGDPGIVKRFGSNSPGLVAQLSESQMRWMCLHFGSRLTSRQEVSAGANASTVTKNGVFPQSATGLQVNSRVVLATVRAGTP